jgi:transposase InsO family protein
VATWTGWVIRGSEAYRKSGAIRRRRRAVNITYIRLAEEFVYLAVVMDAFSRKVVGWALADHLQAARRSRRSTRPSPRVAVR